MKKGTLLIPYCFFPINSSFFAAFKFSSVFQFLIPNFSAISFIVLSIETFFPCSYKAKNNSSTTSLLFPTFFASVINLWHKVVLGQYFQFAYWHPYFLPLSNNSFVHPSPPHLRLLNSKKSSPPSFAWASIKYEWKLRITSTSGCFFLNSWTACFRIVSPI